MVKVVIAGPKTSESTGFACDSTAQPAVVNSVAQVAGITMDVLGLPFDVARAQYARAVQVGLLERSMLASRDFSRAVGALEQLTLGPWARHV